MTNHKLETLTVHAGTAPDPATKAPRPVPPVLPESAEEKRRFEEARKRREHRLSMRR